MLPGWGPPPGIFHAMFPARRALVPAVRRLIDFLADNLDGDEPHDLPDERLMRNTILKQVDIRLA